VLLVKKVSLEPCILMHIINDNDQILYVNVLIWLKSGENKPFNSIKLNQLASNRCFIIYIILD